jgi:cytidylate kinase
MGSGKSLFIKMLSKRLGYKQADGGTIRRAMAKEHGMTIEEFSEYGKKHPEFDRETDRRLYAIADKGKVVIQSRVLPYLPRTKQLPSVYTIYLEAGKRVRAHRIALREKITQAQALRNIDIRDRNDHQRYKTLYGIDTKRHNVYDLVVNNTRLTPNETVKLVLSKLRNI